MEIYESNGTLVISVEKKSISRLAKSILEELKKHQILETNNIFRGVRHGDLQTILKHGTDKIDERSFEYWLDNYLETIKSDRDVNIIREACLDCKEHYTFDSVVMAVNELRAWPGKSLYINCPYITKTQINNRFLGHPDCPTYMVRAGGSRVFFGVISGDSWPKRSETEIIKNYLEHMAPDKSHNFYNHLLIYDAGKIDFFDVELFIFKEGIKQIDALKCVITAH